jgi:hypothetical protein
MTTGSSVQVTGITPSSVERLVTTGPPVIVSGTTGPLGTTTLSSGLTGTTRLSAGVPGTTGPPVGTTNGERSTTRETGSEVTTPESKSNLKKREDLMWVIECLARFPLFESVQIYHK